MNRSTYYKRVKSEIEPSQRVLENQRIAAVILQIHGKYFGRFGAYKVRHVLERDYGIKISVGRVYRLIHKLELFRVAAKKKYKRPIKSDETGACVNYLRQEFNPCKPNMVWASDFTHIRCEGRCYYLCIVLDLYSRKVIAWNLSKKPDAEMVISTFKDAFRKRNEPQGLMFHSDRGCQYTAFAFRKLLSGLNIVQSFSKKGYPYDNACCESFFKYLKQEVSDLDNYPTFESLRLSIFEYIEGFYNTKRPHITLNMMTPDEKERKYKTCIEIGTK